MPRNPKVADDVTVRIGRSRPMGVNPIDSSASPFPSSPADREGMSGSPSDAGKRGAIQQRERQNGGEVPQVSMSEAETRRGGGFTITSSINNDSKLVRAAEEAARDEKVQRDLDALKEKLASGNLSPGLGTKGIKGTSGILELRSANGARLYVRQTGTNAYEIVAKSSKANQVAVIQQLQKLYPKK